MTRNPRLKPGDAFVQNHPVRRPCTHPRRSILASGLMILVLAVAARGAEPAKPHILLVTFDTLRVDHVGAYASGPSHTPSFDALATNALVHEAAFTTMPTTSPAHASLFTGLHPYQHGVRKNGMELSPQRASVRSLPAKLQKAGYATAAFVTSEAFGPNLMGLEGFELKDLPSEAIRPGADVVDAALEWIDDTEGQPTFLWVHLFDAHSPYGAAAEKAAHYPVDHSRYGWIDRSRYADPAARVQMTDAYARGVRDADAALGRLVSGVRRRLDSDPVIIVTADHGEFLDENLDSIGFAFGHGSILDEAVLHIPLLVTGPGVRPGRSSGAVSIRDLYTTVLEAAGVGDPSSEHEGRRDLRTPSSLHRTVVAERRRFVKDDAARQRIGDEALDQIRKNAVAVADGTNLIVVGEDGGVRPGGDRADEELETVARGHLAARDDATVSQPERAIDDMTRHALERLGYLE